MSDPYFFGYGSLVNRRTHAYPDAEPVRVEGWRRAWQGTTLRKVAFLTALRDPGTEIDGLMAKVPQADWVALDEREKAYDRHPVDVLGHGLKPEPRVQIYAVSPHLRAPDQYSILLSYLDTVIQGYLDVFGVAGAQAFFDTTSGWDCPIIDDRHNPIYPRATELSDGERAFVDEALRRVGARGA